MSTIKTKRDDTLLSNWESMPERAPSLERADRPLVARFMAMIGLFLFVLGGLALIAPTWSRTTAIGPGWGFFFGSIGLCLLLFHAFSEHDLQFRRLYGVAGLALILGGVILRLVAFRSAANMPWFFLGGVPGMFIGLNDPGCRHSQRDRPVLPFAAGQLPRRARRVHDRVQPVARAARPPALHVLARRRRGAVAHGLAVCFRLHRATGAEQRARLLCRARARRCRCPGARCRRAPLHHAGKQLPRCPAASF